MPRVSTCFFFYGLSVVSTRRAIYLVIFLLRTYRGRGRENLGGDEFHRKILSSRKVAKFSPNLRVLAVQ